MPIILKRTEASKIYNISIAAWPLVFATLPILNVIARSGLVHKPGNLGFASTSDIMLWAVLIFVIAMSKIGGTAYRFAPLSSIVFPVKT